MAPKEKTVGVWRRFLNWIRLPKDDSPTQVLPGWTEVRDSKHLSELLDDVRSLRRRRDQLRRQLAQIAETKRRQEDLRRILHMPRAQRISELSQRPDLAELWDALKNYQMTDEEREAQRQSFARGQLGMGSDADEARERAEWRKKN